MYSGEISVVNIQVEMDSPPSEHSTEMDMAKVFGGLQPDDPPKEDDLITAVFQQIRLPEVRFAQSPTGSTPSPPNSTPAPPNSFRSDGLATADATPRTPTPRRALDEGEEEEEEEEEPSLHLRAHRNSLQKGWAQQNVQGDEEEGTTPRGTMTEIDSRPSTGIACLDSIRSMEATIGGDTPRKTEEEEEGEGGEEEGDFEGRSRGSSQLSRGLINSAMENVLQNYSAGTTTLTVNVDDDDGPLDHYEEKNDKFVAESTENCHQNAEPPIALLVRDRPTPLHLEIDNIQGNGTQNQQHRLSQLSHSSTTSGGGGGQCSPMAYQKGGDVHVRTPLNNPASPFALPSSPLVTAFEPEKQELIRREIGSKGPEGIRRMVDRFQRGQSLKGDNEEEEEEKAKQKSQRMVRQKSAHFQFYGNGGQQNSPSPEAEENQRPKRKNTPHPFPDGQLEGDHEKEESGEMNQIVAESQRPVADILSQFQRREFQHAKGKSSPMANGDNGTKFHRQNSAESNGGLRNRVGSYGTGGGHGGGQQSIWANGNNGKIVMREPAPGSLAAIRKSLSGSQSTISSAPTSPGPYQNGQFEQSKIGPNGNEPPLKSGQTTPNGGSVHGKGGVQPKNVSQFYRLWGSGQAQSAGNGHCQMPIKANGNGGELSHVVANGHQKH